MDEKVLAKYLQGLSESEIHNELLKYRGIITSGVIERSYNKWLVYLKKKRSLNKKRINKGYGKAVDYINQQIMGGKEA